MQYQSTHDAGVVVEEAWTRDELVDDQPVGVQPGHQVQRQLPRGGQQLGAGHPVSPGEGQCQLLVSGSLISKHLL